MKKNTEKAAPEHSVSWSSPCSNFNGKEGDWESGFHYYGARYYWSEVLTGWLSVDPMMDKYPGMSPYHYCHWNPINLIDPDGRIDDEWKVNKCGEIVERIADGKPNGKVQYVCFV